MLDKFPKEMLIKILATLDRKSLVEMYKAYRELEELDRYIFLDKYSLKPADDSYDELYNYIKENDIENEKIFPFDPFDPYETYPYDMELDIVTNFVFKFASRINMD